MEIWCFLMTMLILNKNKRLYSCMFNLNDAHRALQIECQRNNDFPTCASILKIKNIINGEGKIKEK